VQTCFRSNLDFVAQRIDRQTRGKGKTAGLGDGKKRSAEPVACSPTIPSGCSGAHDARTCGFSGAHSMVSERDASNADSARSIPAYIISYSRSMVRSGLSTNIGDDGIFLQVWLPIRRYSWYATDMLSRFCLQQNSTLPLHVFLLDPCDYPLVTQRQGTKRLLQVSLTKQRHERNSTILSRFPLDFCPSTVVSGEITPRYGHIEVTFDGRPCAPRHGELLRTSDALYIGFALELRVSTVREVRVGSGEFVQDLFGLHSKRVCR
jgi:hypothetical protein